MWHPLHVTPQTWFNNNYFKSEGYILINIALRQIQTKIYPSKTFAYSECKKLNENNEQPNFFQEKENES